jgi:hypothetical protein
MTTDPIIVDIARDAATAAQLVAAMSAGDQWEIEHVLDGVVDLTQAKKLLAATAAHYVNFATEVCAHNGIDHVDFLHRVAVEQMTVADQMQSGES